MGNLDELIAQVEAAGFDWALARYSGQHYGAAVVKSPCEFMGDEVHGPSGVDGATPYAALLSAFEAARGE